MTDAAATDPLGNIPRYVIFRGKKARVLEYEDGKFLILDHHDQKRLVPRNQLVFLPENK